MDHIAACMDKDIPAVGHCDSILLWPQTHSARTLAKITKSFGIYVKDLYILVTLTLLGNKISDCSISPQMSTLRIRFINNIEELGNTGSASAPLVLAQNINEIKSGEKVALMVFGGGYSCGCFIVEK